MCFAYYVAEAQKKGCQASLELETICVSAKGPVSPCLTGTTKDRSKIWERRQES